MLPDILTPHQNRSTVSGIPNILGLAYALSHSPLQPTLPLIIICDHIKEARILQELLTQMTTAQVNILSAESSSVWSALHLAPNHILIAQKEIAHESVLPSFQHAQQSIRKLRVGDAIDLVAIKTWLSDTGYERNTSANLPWTFAARGEILDVYAHEPVRIETENDRIDRMYTFDLATGEKQKNISVIDLLPKTFSGTRTLLDVISERVTVLTWNTALETDHPYIQVDSLASAADTAIALARVADFSHRMHELPAYAEQFSKLILCSSHPERLASTLNLKEPKIIAIDTETEGCADTQHSVLMLTDHTIGGKIQSNGTPKRKKKKIPVIMSLKPGDYVVHMFHGIAQFTGMTHMTVNDCEHEYFVLEYAKGDKIYVPVQLADIVDVYVGDPNPKIGRLSDASWNEVVRKVREQALEMARDLLHTYARRSIAQAPLLTTIPEEEQLNTLCGFELTTDQKTALADVFGDAEQAKPMDRLLCGDVGFGKTEIAIRLAFRAAFHHQQVAILTPTTVLAQQHFDTFTDRLNTFGIRVAALSRFQSPKEQKETLKGIENGTVDIVVGTHRLLSKDVRWKSLGVIVIDEEQRFGVKAKEGLHKYRSHSHVLTMTATPIPRTLNLSLSGIRDISTILTAPLERKTVDLHIQRFDTDVVREAVNRELERKGQVYYISNRVQGIERKKQELEILFPHARIGIAHGQLDDVELARIMHAFDVGEVDILLATTIVENGLDIPRANTIVVEHATHFGLAELYQLKGRVGRSTIQGYAYMLYNEQELDGDARKRLDALQDSGMLGAGFELALRDMEIRGVGNILGKDQHGHAVKIGLNLYGRLLNQAVAELEGNPEPPERDIPIELPLSARIPETLYPEITERIMLYQELANYADPDDLRLRKASYNHLPAEFAGLFDLLEIKLLASHSPLLSIDTLYPSAHNQLDSARITLTSERPLPPLSDEWEIVYTKSTGATKARATIKTLGDNWVEKIKTAILTLGL